MTEILMSDRELLERARDASAAAYAPYSGYRVGAALLTAGGEVVTGVNVENSSYGLTVCAERVALATAVSRGLAEFRTLAVYAGGDSLPYPCGACRQVAWELAPDLRVVVGNDRGEVASLELRDMLPRPFGSGGERGRNPRK